MGNSTINPIGGQSLHLHDDTQIYLCAGPSVRLFEVDVLEQVRSILNIRKSGFDIARAVLVRQGGEDVAFELRQDKFAEAIWPDKEPGARVKQFKRGLKNLREDMEATGFQIIEAQKQKPKLTEDGFRGLPTLYSPGVYWQLSDTLQERAKVVDFFSMPLDQRRRKVRAELKAILTAMGCRRRDSEKKTEDIKPAKPSLPCSCACAQCVRCAAKPATASEADGAEPVLSVQIQNAKDRGLKIERDMVALGTDLLNLGNKISVVDSKLDALSKSARIQIKTAVARKAGRGADYAPDTEARAHGRAALELAIDALKDAQAQAELIGKGKHGAKFEELWKALQQWRVFENRAEVSFEGGQPK